MKEPLAPNWQPLIDCTVRAIAKLEEDQRRKFELDCQRKGVEKVKPELVRT